MAYNSNGWLRRGFVAITFGQLLVSAIAHAEGSKNLKIFRNPEHGIAGLRFDKGKLKTDADIVAAYGQGCHTEGFPSYRRYYEPASNIYVEFEATSDNLIDSVRITGLPIASTACVITGHLPSLATGKGLRIGDSDKKVVQLFGGPYYRGSKVRSNLQKRGFIRMGYRDYAECIDRSPTKCPYEGFGATIAPHSGLDVILSRGRVVEISLGVADWIDIKGEAFIKSDPRLPSH